MLKINMQKAQLEFCSANDYDCEITQEDEKVGFALSTQGKIPLNGLRHLREEDASGWYIWCGEEYSSDPDFFSPLHAKHMVERCPEVVEYLALAPGYRFLLAGEHVDIWFDPSLLQV